MNVVVGIPLYVMSAAALLAIVSGAFTLPRDLRRLPEWIGLLGVGITLITLIAMWDRPQSGFAGEIRLTHMSMLMSGIILVATLATIALSWGEPAGAGRRGEYIGLILAAATGMMLTVVAGDLIVMFIGIELLSVSLYILCAIEVTRERSLESGLKYLITGAIGTAILIYGFALLYGMTGSTSLNVIGERLAEAGPLTSQPLLVSAMALVAVALGFKASAVPFHMWTPDVYEGAPTPITTFMSTGTKTAAMGAFLLVFTGAAQGAIADWRVLIGAISAASMVVGNIGALRQTSVKRMLAWSSVAQAGYLLMGVAVGTAFGAEALIYYLIAYLAMTLAAFAIVILREREVEDGDQLDAFTGYGRRRPWAGVVMTLAMLSLAGFPPLAGFIGKFMLFSAAIDSDMLWLAIVGALASAVSVVYYLRVSIVMWSPAPVRDVAERTLRVPRPVAAVAVAGGMAIIALAIWAQPVIDLCRDAGASLLP